MTRRCMLIECNVLCVSRLGYLLACMSVPRLVIHRDAGAAVAWMARALGTQAVIVVNGPKDRPAHVELKLGSSTCQYHPKH